MYYGAELFLNNQDAIDEDMLSGADIMNNIQEYIKRPIVAGGVGFVLGLIIGLFLLGWGLFPVQWTDAAPQHLREDAKVDYLQMVIESYTQNQDQRLARQRWLELGSDAPDVLNKLEGQGTVSQESINVFRNLVNQPIPAQTTTVEDTQGETTAETSTPLVLDTNKSKKNPLFIFGLFCMLTLIIGAILFFVIMARRKSERMEYQPVDESSYEETDYPTESFTDETAGNEEKEPITQFMSTYMAGDDLYDDSYSIDSLMGEFLGECGVGVSETIGVGEPKKVTAFEVWLFDKNDIQTVTKVLMSTHAFNDDSINQKLASKGEPILMEAGKNIVMETATLKLEARVIDMSYGKGSMPDNSYFDRMTLELVVWHKDKN